jgi:type I restriction enzyme S subunit
MREMNRVRLGDVADFLTGFPFKSAEYIEDDSGVRLIRGDNIVQGRLRWDGVKRWPRENLVPYRDYLLQPGDVVLAMDRPWIDAGLKYSSVGEEDCPSLLVQRVTRLRGTESLDSGYLRYLIGSRAFTDYVLAVQTGTAVPHISGGQIKAFDFDLPRIQTQKAIAQTLSALDDKIELNRRMNETLEAMARAIFKDWFVDFGPTREKMDGRESYLTPELWALFPDRLNDEEKPKGWSTEPILKHAHLLSGGTPKTAEPAYWGGPIRWASAKDVSQCGEPFLLETERSITARGLEESSTRLIPSLSTVMVARGATTGRFCMFGSEIAMNQTCYALLTKASRPFWINCVFASLVDSIVHAAHGSVFDTITTKTIESAMSIVPSNALLDQFENIVSPLFMTILKNTEVSRTLSATRDLVLPKLMSGEIRLRDAEKMVEAAA